MGTSSSPSAERIGIIMARIADWLQNLKSFRSRKAVPALCAFATWKTITLGSYATSEDLSNALTDCGFQIGDYAAQILKKTALARAETDRELVRATVGELGLKKGALRNEIYNHAREFGLDCIPAEAGPQLRRQYTDQPPGESLLMAMKPIADFDGDLYLFRVEHNSTGLWLDVGYGYHDDIWDTDDCWVFSRRK